MNCIRSITDKQLVLILGLAGFISAADNWIVSPILPAIAAGFAVSIAQVGIILTAYLIPYGIMQPVYGYISDRWGKAKILKWIVFGLAFGTIGCAIAPSLWVLCLWRLITGFFAAGVIAVSLAMIGDTVALSDRQKYVGKFMGIVFLGQGLSVGLGGIFANFISWRIAFISFAVLTICILPFMQKLPKDVSTPTNYSFFNEVKQVTLTPKGKVIFPLALATGFLLLGLYSYLGAFFHEVTGLNYVQVGLIVMCYGFACLLAGHQIGNLGQKFGHQKTILLGGFLALSTALILASLPYWPAGLLATVSLGFGYIFIQSTLATIAFDVATEHKGLPSALIGLGLFGGGGLGTAFGSFLLSWGNYQTLWLCLASGIALFIVATSKLHFD
ncbi:MFS transporter [Sporomusa acidovorans]|uniref:Sugar efflux transporter n=1 Tax=Sporomusa acidovorans (strain ATCC 49682 / DSM 3132 / Mol) TaxID=1123286 RepID=A0ABZ3J668_SPOA4|nr:MFS transporter [Sporomusa acidovorans]OZC15369.1 purine efflux pump PbuE [Sporomusa acidovorans DSM 3132]SDF14080.1 Predicted arabinose efflux permease, MFS family [Sporomusa acidovorans]